MPSPTRRWCFILFRCQFPWKPWCFCTKSLEKHLRRPPRNLFLSHSLVFASFLIWYNHSLSGPLQLRSCVLGSIPPSSKGSYTSQPTSSSSGCWPEETSPEDSWDVVIMTLTVLLCRENWGSNVLHQGQSRHLHHEFANNSYQQSTCMSTSDPYLGLVKHQV